MRREEKEEENDEEKSKSKTGKGSGGSGGGEEEDDFLPQARHTKHQLAMLSGSCPTLNSLFPAYPSL